MLGDDAKTKWLVVLGVRGSKLECLEATVTEFEQLVHDAPEVTPTPFGLQGADGVHAAE